jgi:hypothetical protein
VFGRSPVVISFIANIFLPSLSSGTGGKICKRKEVRYGKRAFDCVRRVGRLLGGEYEKLLAVEYTDNLNACIILGGGRRYEMR